ncbi:MULTISPECIES: hypothetical protein [unclassified Streptomyces]|uniref:hypothetical protein n=1 Tax=unclassified Streptomyces TaxID=2593676 RepID=UPI00340B5F74
MPDDSTPEPTSLWDALQQDFLDEAKRHFDQAMDDLDAHWITGNGTGAPIGFLPAAVEPTRPITTSDVPAALRGPRWKP